MLIVKATEVIHFKRLEIVMAHVNVNMHEFKNMLSMYIHVAIGVIYSAYIFTQYSDCFYSVVFINVQLKVSIISISVYVLALYSVMECKRKSKCLYVMCV